jgi:beta-lactamase regulating signal transducer with metallopeptidase domain
MDALARSIGDRLLIGSLEGAIVIALVWVVCRRVSGIPLAARVVLWWLASLNLVFALLPVPSIALPILPAHGSLSLSVEGRSPAPVDAASTSVVRPFTGRSAGVAGAPVRTSTSPRLSLRWNDVAVLVWLAIVVAQAGVLLRRLRHVRALVGRAIPCSADDAAAVAEIAHRLGLRRPPDVRLSTEIAAPQVTGIRRPTILLPARPFTSEERGMMLCHELMHVRRRDLVFGWVPAAAERLFFFHPLARLAAREYVAAREAACDAAVVRALGVSPADYGRLLIRFGVGAPEPALTAGGSAASRSFLRRRLEMLHDAPTARPSRRAPWVVAGAVAALIPMQLAARAPQTAAPAVAAPAAAPSATVAPAPLAQEPNPVPAPAEPAPAAPPPADVPPGETAPTASDRADAPSVHGAAIRQLVESMRLRQQEIGPEAMRRQSEQVARMLGAMQETAEGRRREQEMERSLRQLTEEYEQRLVEMRGNADWQTEQARIQELVRSLEELSRDVRQREQVERDVAAATLRDSLEQLSRQQEVLIRQLQQIAAQQEVLSAAQRRLTEETERIRKQLEASK